MVKSLWHTRFKICCEASWVDGWTMIQTKQCTQQSRGVWSAPGICEKHNVQVVFWYECGQLRDLRFSQNLRLLGMTLCQSWDVPLRLLDPEDEASMLVWTVRIYPVSDTASYPRRLEPSKSSPKWCNIPTWIYIPPLCFQNFMSILFHAPCFALKTAMLDPSYLLSSLQHTRALTRQELCLHQKEGATDRHTVFTLIAEYNTAHSLEANARIVSRKYPATSYQIPFQFIIHSSFSVIQSELSAATFSEPKTT